MPAQMNAVRRPEGNDDPEEPFIPDFSEGMETGLYLALFELFDEGLVITGDEVVLEANSAACRLLERDYRQVAGRPLADLFPSEREFLDARARLFIRGETRGSLRVSLPQKRDRELRFVAAARLRPGIHALILSPARGANTPSAPVDTVWPRLAAALEQPVIVIDDQGRIAAANAAALGTLGFARADLVGHALDSRLGVTWPGRGEPQFARIDAPGHGEPLSGRILPGPKPGWQLLILPANSGKATGALATAHHPDAPPQRAALNDDVSVERLFADCPLPTLLCEGPELRIFAASASAVKAYGYPYERLCRMRLADLRCEAEDGRSLAESGLWRHRHANGTTFDAVIVAYRVDAAGHPDAMVVMHGHPAAAP
ncbi:PAS domain-containing protein [Aromatoleum anaerobium]|uniref:PAS domain-containing protein n=1 Tax=Aromatoleum anaerobium TaxID=182180 RepID=A0ABX1PQT1_9RHOO|nr:PAS domain-containing protein [Aromatoleum anaerobium]MCK0509140.1 PAS domain-containing protein [Aromatoleum anaerobium]